DGVDHRACRPSVFGVVTARDDLGLANELEGELTAEKAIAGVGGVEPVNQVVVLWTAGPAERDSARVGWHTRGSRRETKHRLVGAAAIHARNSGVPRQLARHLRLHLRVTHIDGGSLLGYPVSLDLGSLRRHRSVDAECLIDVQEDAGALNLDV